MKNFVMPSDPHSMHAKANDAPTVVFKPKKEVKKEVSQVSKLKAEKAVEQAPKPVEVAKKEGSQVSRIPEAQEKAIPVEKRAEVAKPAEVKKKIRFEKGSVDAIEWGKEMSLRRKLKKEGTMKEKVVEVKPMAETIVAESVKAPVA